MIPIIMKGQFCQSEDFYSVWHRAGAMFFANNSVIIVSAATKLDQNLVRLTP